MAVQGLRSLERKLRRLPPVVLDEWRKAMERGADRIVAMARSLVPVGDTGRLKDSIGWTWGDPPRGSIILGRMKPSQAKRAAGLVITIYAGNDEAFYARWIEFGTVKMSAQPFFYPSYRAQKKSIKSDSRKAVKKACSIVATLRGV